MPRHFNKMKKTSVFRLPNGIKETCRLIYMTGQSGKTWVMIDDIRISLSGEEDQSKKNVHIIACDNILLHNDQLGSRLDNHQDFKDGSYIVHNSKEGTTLRDLWFGIAEEEKRIVITCNNSSRMGSTTRKNGHHRGDICELVAMFHKYRPGEYAFHIWIDEADRQLKTLNQMIFDCAEFKTSIARINLISASGAERLLAAFGNDIDIRPMESTRNEDIYHCFKDSNVVAIDTCVDYLEFMKKALEKTRPQPKQVWFAPAEHYTTTHDMLRIALNDAGVVVLVINGKGKLLYFPDDPEPTAIDVEAFESKAICDWLYEVYKDKKLWQWPFAITGNNCVGRGITIISQKLMITHAVFPPVLSRDRDTASQIAYRVCGNYKNYRNYKKPTVFCSKEFNDIVNEEQSLSIRLAEYAFKRQQIKVSKDDCSTIRNKHYDHGTCTVIIPPEVASGEDPNVCPTQLAEHTCSWPLDEVNTPAKFEQLKEWMSEITGAKHNPRFSTYFDPSHLTQEGFYMSKTLGRGGDNELQILSLADIFDKKCGLGAMENSWRLMIAYKDINDPTSGVIVFKCRRSDSSSLKRKREEEQNFVSSKRVC